MSSREDSAYIALVFQVAERLRPPNEVLPALLGKEFSMVDDTVMVREFDSNKQFHLDDRGAPR